MLLALYFMLDVICGKERQQQQNEDANVSSEVRHPVPRIEVQSPSSTASYDESPNSSLDLANRLKAEDTTRLR